MKTPAPPLPRRLPGRRRHRRADRNCPRPTARLRLRSLSRSALPRAARARTASCCGPASRRGRWKAAACPTARSLSTGRSPRTRTLRAWPRRRTAQAAPAQAHSVHVEVKGLQPGRHYWYRFRAGDALSPIGRTRTAPAAGSTPAQFRFAFASCQQYEQGYFAAYRDMANRGSRSRRASRRLHLRMSWGQRLVRQHAAASRRRLSSSATATRSTSSIPTCRPPTPPSLARRPGTTTRSPTTTPTIAPARRAIRAQFLRMRAAAYQAYYEHMPLPASARPRGPLATIYERYRFGDTARRHAARRPAVSLAARPASARPGRAPWRTAPSARSRRAACWAASRSTG